MSQLKLHSIVVPIFNEEAGITALYERMQSLCKNIVAKWPDFGVEVILVNDGSRDRSLEKLEEISKKDPQFKVIDLSRNFGHQLAITAGIEWSKGQTVTVIDADLQDPPEVILEMIQKWKEGFDVVFAVRRHRAGETWFKLFTAKWFYRLIRSLTQVDIPLDTGDFRLMDRKAVDSLIQMKERHRFVRGMVSWVGFKQTGILYDRHERQFGSTNYPLKKMLKFAMDGITSFSTIPLRISLYLGFAAATVSFFYGLWVLYGKFFNNQAAQGWTSLMLVCLFLGGAQLFSIGILGEYLGRTYEEVKGRPLFLVRRAFGFERDHDSK